MVYCLKWGKGKEIYILSAKGIWEKPQTKATPCSLLSTLFVPIIECILTFFDFNEMEKLYIDLFLSNLDWHCYLILNSPDCAYGT